MDDTVKSHASGHAEHAPTKPSFVLWRPSAKTGLMSWLTTVDHK
jgi:cytochrome c oxidase subunit 1